ncbi:hypothetical protein ACP70R_010447 [Stipagrostis hirtigluma subsp. patula]
MRLPLGNAAFRASVSVLGARVHGVAEALIVAGGVTPATRRDLTFAMGRLHQVWSQTVVFDVPRLRLRVP